MWGIDYSGYNSTHGRLGAVEAQLAFANMRLAAMERQRDSARRVARALREVLRQFEALAPTTGTGGVLAWVHTVQMMEARVWAYRVLAEEARREKEAK